MLEYPRHFRLSSGAGVNPFHLVSFDNALLSAGLANYNLLKVSSILPINCKESNFIHLKKGSALLVAYGCISSNQVGDVIASAVAVGIPEDDSQVGVIMECSGHYSSNYAEQSVRDMVAIAMQNHGFRCQEIKSSAIEATVDGKGYSTVISALAMW